MSAAISCVAVLFDLDGVLVDSAAAVERSWLEFARRHRLGTDRVLAVCHGRPSVETIRILLPEADAPAVAVALEREQAADVRDIVACAGAAALLERLPADRWAVVTSGTRPLATARIRAAGLPLPRIMVAAGDVPRGKPAPDGYLEAARLLDASPADCVVVEDAAPGGAAARAAGMRVVGMTGTGLRPDAGLDVVAASLDELRLRVEAPVGRHD
ncbi:MAG: HAD-IA family hydrolase [Dactylosporangium sp.]|nr:HAD-IA family hydrolase [Dactylosporangium sp.]NNJ63606.1 HAD-IA family hydrolase [Dactylosporangium sp.]